MVPSPYASLAALLLAVCVGVLPAAAQHRTLTAITNSDEEHVGAVLSPDGDHVAFRGPDKIAVVRYTGGTEVAVATGRNLGTFVWAPDSLGIYYLDGLEVRYVSRVGAAPRLVATLAETSIALWAIKGDGSDLFGTWLYVRNNGGQITRETQVFALATDGASAPRVLIRSILTVDGVRISPDGTKLVYREYDPTPFTRRDYIVANIDGSIPVSLTGGAGLGLNPELPEWLPGNASICFARIDRVLGRAVVERLSLTDPSPYAFTYPTAARNVSVSADGRWIAYEGYWSPGMTWTPVVMPAAGGGHVFLDTARTFVFAGTPMVGGLLGDRLVVSGIMATAQRAQVFKVELARELLVQPRADTGGLVDVELPVQTGEGGVVFMTAAPLPVSIPVVGLAGGFQLEPTTMVTVVSGTGSGQGFLRTQLAIPNLAFLRHRAVYLQGVRITSPTPTGDCTHLVELPIF